MPKKRDPQEKRPPLTPDGDDGGAQNKKALIVPNILLGPVFAVDPTPLKSAWTNRQDYKDEKVAIEHHPFRFGECKGFVGNEEFLNEFVEKLQSFEFTDKASDLFQFRQSNDLKSYVDPHIFHIMEYLKGKVLPWLKNVTDLPLNGDIDLFLSDYRKNDFLLCHDDELDSRRIAFILYLNSWKSEWGGNLELFSATESVHPSKVVKSICPDFNKFAFFEVSETSFHQVGEVTEDNVRRLALSGWFYGDPLPRPKIDYPKDEGYVLKDYLNSNKVKLEQFCSEGYLSDETCQDINEQISEESQVLIPGFMLDDIYKKVCEDIVEQDVELSKFVLVGPPNISSYQEMCKGPPPTFNQTENESFDKLKNLQQFFHSMEFLQFLEKITELPFTTSEMLKATSSLRKYSKGSYSLLRAGGEKQTGESRRGVKGSMEDDDKDSVEDVEEDPNLVDVMYYFSNKWDESWGGLSIYCTEDGEQLITIPPEGNCLAVVVRNSTVNSYVNYVNCNAGEEVYFAYTMTYALDGKL